MLRKQSPEDVPHVPMAFARRICEPVTIDDANLSSAVRKDAPKDEIGKNNRDGWTSNAEDARKRIVSHEKFVAAQTVLYP